ncbi:serine/threonine protein kinase, partial [Aphanomyces invadans]
MLKSAISPASAPPSSLHRVHSDSDLTRIINHNPVLDEARQWADYRRQRILETYCNPQPPLLETEKVRCRHVSAKQKLLHSSVGIAKATHGWMLPYACSLCHSSGATCLIAGCGHYFHGSCIVRWLGSHTNCPKCDRFVDMFLPAHLTLHRPRFRKSFSCISKGPNFFDTNFDERYESSERVLGKGTYASVHLGREKTTNTPVAIKHVLKAGLKSDIENVKALEEIAVLHGLHHDNIVNLHAAFSSSFHYILVMDQVDGGTLDDWMHAYVDQASTSADFGPRGPKRPLPEAIVRCVVRDIVAALVYLHTIANVIHGDIKPGNILLDRSAQVCFPVAKLCDFGNAVRMHPGLPLSNDVMSGSFGYMAPELLCKEPLSPSADMWSLGVVAYEALVAYSPFYPYNMCTQEDAMYCPRDFKHVSPACVDFLKKLLTRDPTNRMTALEAAAHPFLQSPPCICA